MIQADANGLYHPSNENDIIDLIKQANSNKLQVRVRGAFQSAPGSVLTDDLLLGNGLEKNINMELDQIRSVSIDKNTNQVTVGGGCNLGFDPFDPSGTSEKSGANNLFVQLNNAGLSIPNVSDVIHQTVAGFISTGSSAGTMQHSFDECILSIRMIDGTGNVQTYNRSTDLNNPFYGAVVSMGLLGIITEVTLQCVPTFNIIGEQSITQVNSCEYDFFDTGTDKRISLEGYLSETEFTRILWWPYKTLQRVITWKARKMIQSDYTDGTGSSDNFKPKPYVPLFPEFLGTTLPSEIVAVSLFELIGTWPDWLHDLTGNNPTSGSGSPPPFIKALEPLFPHVYPLLADMFFPVNSIVKPKQIFWDNWLGSLPMDSVEFSNKLFNLVYSEMCVPIHLTKKAINTLQDFYVKYGYAATGFYTVELAAGKKSDFWLSPAYSEAVIRINIMFFQKNSIKAEDFFTQFWDLFQKNEIPFRPHWGKNLPLPSSTSGPDYLQKQYPKWKDFLSLREKSDPNNIFLTNYWKTHLGI